MRPEDFQVGFPGTLEETIFDESLAGQPLVRRAGWAFVPAPLPPVLDRTMVLGRLYDVLERAQANLLRLNGLMGSLPGRTALLSALRIREAQASSKIENTFATVREVALASVDAKVSTRDAMDVILNMQAIASGLDSNRPICINLAKEMHKVLIVDATKLPGQFRRDQVCIGREELGFANARFVPPPASRVDELMRHWERFCNPTPEDRAHPAWLPVWVNLALAHYQFETIHPFRDGNGRLGRALVTIAPVKDGTLDYPVCNVSEWLQMHHEEYYARLLRVSTHGEWEHWIRFFLTAVAEQTFADVAWAKTLAALYEELHVKLVSKRASILQTKLLDYLFEGHAMTVTIAAKLLGVTYPSAQKHVTQFVQLGILTPIDDRTYGRIYVPEGILQAIRGKGED